MALTPSIYKHKPLGKGRRIRLIYLDVPLGNLQPLTCKIKEISLDSLCNPEYSAMSYSWDAETPSRPLLCEGKAIYITPNCENGLRRLAKMPAGRVMWVDSICI